MDGRRDVSEQIMLYLLFRGIDTDDNQEFDRFLARQQRLDSSSNSSSLPNAVLERILVIRVIHRQPDSFSYLARACVNHGLASSFFRKVAIACKHTGQLIKLYREGLDWLLDRVPRLQVGDVLEQLEFVNPENRTGYVANWIENYFYRIVAGTAGPMGVAEGVLVADLCRCFDDGFNRVGK